MAYDSLQALNQNQGIGSNCFFIFCFMPSLKRTVWATLPDAMACFGWEKTKKSAPFGLPCLLSCVSLSFPYIPEGPGNPLSFSNSLSLPSKIHPPPSLINPRNPRPLSFPKPLIFPMPAPHLCRSLSHSFRIRAPINLSLSLSLPLVAG